MAKVASRPTAASAMSNDARSLLDEILCTVLVAGALLVLLLPAARGTAAIGWLPLWLVGMPAVAWWALRGFPLPRAAVEAPAAAARPARRGRGPAQARRGARPAARNRARHAA